MDNPAEDLRAEALAERAHMSLRNFYRAFESATGTPPAEWVEQARLQVARRLLEQTGQHIDQVALRSGFGSADRLRRVFARRLAVSPAEYRERFTRIRAKGIAARRNAWLLKSSLTGWWRRGCYPP